MNKPYREPGAVDTTAEIHSKLDDILERVKRQRPQLSDDNEFHLRLWPRVLWPFATFGVVAVLVGYGCNRDSNRSQVDIARASVECEQINASRPVQLNVIAAKDGGP